jgi:hypothetical protein
MLALGIPFTQLITRQVRRINMLRVAVIRSNIQRAVSEWRLENRGSFGVEPQGIVFDMIWSGAAKASNRCCNLRMECCIEPIGASSVDGVGEVVGGVVQAWGDGQLCVKLMLAPLSSSERTIKTGGVVASVEVKKNNLRNIVISFVRKVCGILVQLIRHFVM